MIKLDDHHTSHIKNGHKNDMLSSFTDASLDTKTLGADVLGENIPASLL